MPSSTNPSSGIERNPAPTDSAESSETVFQSFILPQGHYRVTQPVFQDVSDQNDTLVHERVWHSHRNQTLELTGNVFVVEDVLTGRGTIYVLKGPLPHARPEPADWDFRLRIDDSSGVVSDLNRPAGGMEWAVLEFEGGRRGRTLTLHKWQRDHRPTHARHHRQHVLSNTWGDRSRDSRMNQTFMEEEIRLAAAAGIDVVQLDDGWQKGMTVNSALALKGGGNWEGFWNVDPEFWTPHPERFPRGLEPLVRAAAEQGVALGLWFAPDSRDDFANWQRDADCLAELYRRHDVAFFKLDGVKCLSERAYANLNRLIESLREQTAGAVVCDLDITAGVRPGPFGLLGSGVLFVENRYTDWHSYWPHHTLRNLWTYCGWVDPLRLRFEMLNPERNSDLYSEDPWAPSAYDFDAIAATVLAGQPLGWFEVGGLSEPNRQALRRLLDRWKPLRESFFRGAVLPVGECPEGWGCSGFLSLDEAGKEWILLLFRGLNPRSEYRLHLPVNAKSGMRWELSSGEGDVSVDGDQLTVGIPRPLGYAIGRLLKT